jgi:hypothetical protein
MLNDATRTAPNLRRPEGHPRWSSRTAHAHDRFVKKRLVLAAIVLLACVACWGGWSAYAAAHHWHHLRDAADEIDLPPRMEVVERRERGSYLCLVACDAPRVELFVSVTGDGDCYELGEALRLITDGTPAFEELLVYEECFVGGLGRAGGDAFVRAGDVPASACGDQSGECVLVLLSSGIG